MAVVFKQTQQPIKEPNGTVTYVGLIYDNAVPTGPGSVASPFPDGTNGADIDVAYLADWCIKRFSVWMNADSNAAAVAAKTGVEIAGAVHPSAVLAIATQAAERALFKAGRRAVVTARGNIDEIAALDALELLEDGK